MIVFAIFVFLICLNTYRLNALPSRQYVHVGDGIAAGLKLPGLIRENASVYLRSPGESFNFNLHQAMPVAQKPGHLDMEVKLFGLIPIHRVTVNVVDPQTVIPGGQSIGVLLHSEGVMVVGEAAVQTARGEIKPAREAGISVGDLIIQVNDQKLTSEHQLQQAVDRCGRLGKKVTLVVKHGNKIKKLSIKPGLCRETGRYRIGLFVKDSTAGVGTLTFYEPHTKTYGALGHMINNYSGEGGTSTYDGKIVEASVKGLHPGRKGEPGEKMGVFKGESDIVGTIEKNTRYGIFGRLEKAVVTNPYYNKPVAVALSYQVKPGPAEILTVLDENKIERFTVQIMQVWPGNQNKGLVIKVTDRELIRRTGGIIQGMSGSPIIQDGRLVGAVTHVFINDPTKGYGVLAENMLKEANLLKDKNFQKKAG